MLERERVCVREIRERERKRECVCKRERESVCVCKREIVCVCVLKRHHFQQKEREGG